jgi:hypothetical protein
MRNFVRQGVLWDRGWLPWVPDNGTARPKIRAPSKMNIPVILRSPDVIGTTEESKILHLHFVTLQNDN